MGKEKDTAERQLESYNDVFADIFNTLLFGGRPVISPAELRDAQPVSQFKADGALHQEERDEAKYWKNGALCLGLLGLENQTASENVMPVRVFGYDGASYRGQLIQQNDDRRAGRPVRPLYPVVTLVLNFAPRRWSGHTSLLDCLTVPPELRPFVQDYRIHVFDIAFLPPETVAAFRSDFHILADYLVQLRTRNDYVPPPQIIRHVDALFKLMEAASGVQGFMEQLEEQRREGKEPNRMTGFLLERTNRDRAIGRTEGISIGRAEGISIGRTEGISIGRTEGISIGRTEGISIGRTEGIAVGIAESVRALMDSMGWDRNEAMDMLRLTPDQRDACRKVLDSEAADRQ